MLRLGLLWLSVLVLAACVDAGRQVPGPAMQPVAVAATDGWFPDERLVPSSGPADQFGIPTHRRGNTPEGYRYSVFPDGSGSVATPSQLWSIDCRQDAMTDKRECSISAREGRLFVFYGTSDAPEAVCILGHDFPSRRGAIRVDQGSPRRTADDGCVGAAIMQQLMVGRKVITRRVEWPHDFPKDDEGPLEGLVRATELVARIRES